ncbi:MAG: serine--tRNA ligase, partial [Bacteroidales bacterium]|nr:serine--tRNA ligase [Bacteroidales bacterium]
MLTLKLITEQYDRVIAGLNKKHFNGAKEAIDAVIAKDQERRATQKELDDNLAKSNQLAKSIGALMKEGKKAEAEEAKAEVAALKGTNKQLDDKKAELEQQINAMLCQIPNIPYDEVPEGTCAEDNWVVKSNLKECVLGEDKVGNWTVNPDYPDAKLPHWEVAKNLNLIDFDLGVKITGAGLPVDRGLGARLQRALINFFLTEAGKAGYEEIMPPTVVNKDSGYGTGQLPDKEGQMYHCEVDDFYLIP